MVVFRKTPRRHPRLLGFCLSQVRHDGIEDDVADRVSVARIIQPS